MTQPLKQVARAGYLSAIAVFALAFTNIAKDAKASDCTANGYVGTVCWTAADYCPPQHVPANGTLVAVADHKYQMLYTLTHFSFGGDWRMLFALPDIRGRTIVGASRDTTIASPHEAGQSYGKEEIILKPENIPPHTHKWQFREAKITGTLRASTSIGNSASPENRIPAARPSSGPASKQMPVYGTLTNTRLNLSAVTLFTDPATDRTEKTGSANPAPISLRPLQTGLLACIKIAGEYPNRY